MLLSLLLLSACSSVHKEITIHRENYKADFLKDPRSPLTESDLHHLDFFPPSAHARVTAIFKATPGDPPFEMPTYSGITRSYRKWGEATFLWRKDSITLSIYENLTLIANPLYKDYLFLPFKDATNGLTTYGGGRYLNMSKADTEDGVILIDFNKAYNPWCAYSDGYNCPIPPTENQILIPIDAGEKQYKGQIRH